jgi:DNA polymerase-3 subunit delta'
MTSIIGNTAAQSAFMAAMRGGSLHHAWLIAGPQGVGKASFARAAAMRMLADAAEPDSGSTGLEVAEGNRTRSLIEAGSHPDFRVLARLPKDPDKPDLDLARSITIAQVRTLQPLFATTPSMSPRRVVVIDAIDDLERGGANALLKNLEEPPAGTIFLLVSHAPGSRRQSGRCSPMRTRARSRRWSVPARAHPAVRFGMPGSTLLRSTMPSPRSRRMATAIMDVG